MLRLRLVFQKKITSKPENGLLLLLLLLLILVLLIHHLFVTLFIIIIIMYYVGIGAAPVKHSLLMIW